MRHPLCLRLLQIGGKKASWDEKSGEAIDYGMFLRDANNMEAAGSIVATAIAKAPSRALPLSEENIDTIKPAPLYDVESLIAFELRSWFTIKIKVDISVSKSSPMRAFCA